MTVAGQKVRTAALAGLMLPPWLWLWLAADLLAGIPSQFAQVRDQVAVYSGHGGVPPQLTAQAPYTLLSLFAIVATLPSAVLLAGAVAAMFPWLRCRWVERRFGLGSDDRPVMTAMREFVARYDPSIELRSTVRADQLARIYPVGWRTARVAVFRPLTILWRRDREAAEAVLLHEIAHRRQGDQLIVGLGSPFVWLIRLWTPMFVALVFVPLVIYFALGGGLLAQTVSAQGVLELFDLPRTLALPIAALWLAEISADRLAAATVGTDVLRRALEVTSPGRASRVARAMALLSHPPRRLRTRTAAAGAGLTTALLDAWPAALVAQLLVTLVAAVIAYPLLEATASGTGRLVVAGLHSFLVNSRIMLIVTVVVLLAWPALARFGQRLRSTGPGLATGRSWPPYLVAVALPACLVVGSVIPVPASFPSFARAGPAFCGSLKTWAKHGLTEKARVDSDLLGNRGGLAAAARTALDHPPPGEAARGYRLAMTDFAAAGTDWRDGQQLAAISEIEAGLGPDIVAGKLLSSQLRKCRKPRRAGR